VLTTIEAALSGGVILRARDGCCRDMASMHGSYCKVEETLPAIQLIGDALCQWKVESVRWLLDRPVSNSGRLKTILAESAAAAGWTWDIELVPDPDKILKEYQEIAATADSQILDAADRWTTLAAEIVASRVPDAWQVDLGDEPPNNPAGLPPEI